MAQVTVRPTRKSHVVKVTGVTDELLGLLDGRVRARHSTGRSEYIRDLLRQDLLGEPTFRQILAPIHAQRNAMPESDEEIDALLATALDEVRAERRAAQP
jgi:hypothetical protein